MLQNLRSLWRRLRSICGDDAYECYLAHWREHHAGEEARPLDRKAFFEAELHRRWSGIRRCC